MTLEHNNDLSNTMATEDNQQDEYPQQSNDSSPDDELVSVMIENELFEVPKRYQMIELRGSGSYGVVCAAKDTLTGKMVAIKKNRNVFPRTVAPLKPHQNGRKQQPVASLDKKLAHRSKLSQKRILRELKILNHLGSHPNIVQLYDIIPPRSYEAFGDLYFITDLMEADLRDILESNQALTEQHVQYFLYQILLSVHYSQSANIIHRDLKPENILLNSNCELKICDYGLARGIDFRVDPRMSTNYVQTRWYRAPELLLNNPTISEQTDMWSIGCIFGELLGRKVFFRGSCPVDQMKRIISVLGTPRDITDIKGSEDGIKFVMDIPHTTGKNFKDLFPNVPPHAIDLLKKMLVFNHEKRITTADALKHPYFADLYDSRDVREHAHKFDFSFEKDIDDGSEAIKKVAFETVCQFKNTKRQQVLQNMGYGTPNSVATDSRDEEKQRRMEEEKIKKQKEEDERRKEEEKMKQDAKKKEERRKKGFSRFNIFKTAKNSLINLMN